MGAYSYQIRRKFSAWLDLISSPNFAAVKIRIKFSLNMNSPQISVIIPCYNAEATIHETIASILEQTFTDFEIIIINDGSIDNTLQVINQFSDERIQVFSFANSGPQKSRNRGIEIARGDYISFIDADALWTPDKLASQVQSLQASPNAALAYSWTDLINEHGQFVKCGRHSKIENHVFEQLIKDDFIASGSNPLIKAEALRAVGGFDEAILAGQDWDMWLTLAAEYQFVVVPKVQILYRKFTSHRSWSDDFERQAKGHLQVMNKHLNVREHSINQKRVCFASRYRYFLFHCLEQGSLNVRNGLLVLRFFILALFLEPAWWLKRYHLIAIVLVKSGRCLLAPFYNKENVLA